MNKSVLTVVFVGLVGGLLSSANASPEDDRKQIVELIEKRFPGVPFDEYKNGVYAIDQVARSNWEAIEEFPPYEVAIDNGKAMWNTPFANGKGYKDCFPNGPAIAGQYPYWDRERGMVMTLNLAINACREANGEKALGYNKGPIADLTAYIAYQSRGQITNVVVPEDDPRALAAYEAGKKFYFTRRGQLNFACAHCHIQNPGNLLRTELLSAVIGQTTGWPVYRAKWGEMGTLHRRFKGCNNQVRAKAMKPQSEQYRNLEYFLTSLSNGMELNGPSARK